jgi:hypothetical protein
VELFDVVASVRRASINMLSLCSSLIRCLREDSLTVVHEEFPCVLNILDNLFEFPLFSCSCGLFFFRRTIQCFL